MRRTERLINLVAALLDTDRPLGRDDIHERVPGYADDQVAFRRAFERDKETLRSMGIPLDVQTIADADWNEQSEGYRIPREAYEMPDPGLTAQELAALQRAASVVSLEGQTATAAMWKLGGASETGSVSGRAISELGPRLDDIELPHHDQMDRLFTAIGERRELTFGYKGRTRQVQPHRLSYRNGHWYLNGYDTEQGEGRSFRLDRMDRMDRDPDRKAGAGQGDVQVGPPNAFPPPVSNSQPQVPAWQLGDEPPTSVTLLVDPDQAQWVIGYVGRDAVTEDRGDGSVVVTLEVSNREAFRSFTLSLLDHAEILGPPAFRDDLCQWLKQLTAAS